MHKIYGVGAEHLRACTVGTREGDEVRRQVWA